MLLGADFFTHLAMHYLRQANDIPLTPARGPVIRPRRAALPATSTVTVRRLPAPRR